MSDVLTQLDYIAILLYLAGTLALGFWIGRRVRSGTDYFLAGRSLPWWAIGMSLVATDIGGTDIIGVGGAAASHGLAVANFEWIGCVPAMIVAAFVFVPFFYRTGVYTVPEFMERRYNAGVRSALALCWLLFMACNLGIMLLASARMMSGMFDTDAWIQSLGFESANDLYDWQLAGWQPVPAEAAVYIWLTVLLVGFYTIVGGLAAVVYTDAIQCAVMIGGCLLVLVLGLIDVGGIDGLRERLAEVHAESGAAANRTSLIVPADADSPYPWPAIYFGLALILSPAYWIGNQAIVQRSLGAKSEFQAKAAYIWGAVLKNVIPFIIAVPGLIALAKFSDLENGDEAFPRLVRELLPAGVRGIFVAGFIAALMSSIDSYLNSASTILSFDLYKRFLNRDADDRRLLTVGRWTTVGLLVWAVVFAYAFLKRSEESGIYAVFQTLMSFFQGPALAILLGGLFWKRATGTGALAAFLSGIVCAVSLFTLNQQPVYEALDWQPLFRIPDPFLYYSIWAFLVAVLVLVGVSLLTRPDPDDKTQFVLRGNRGGGS